MSLAPNPMNEGKFCFVYCGDERCDCGAGLRDDLLQRQPDAELERKAAKAKRKDQFTQEDIDLAKRRAERAIQEINWS